MSLAKGTRVRVREDFEWSYDRELYSRRMANFGGKYGTVRDCDEYNGAIMVDLDDEDNSANWTFYAKDIEVVDVAQGESSYCVGDMVRVIPGFIERERANPRVEILYNGTMRKLEGNEYPVLYFDTWLGRKVAVIDELNDYGIHTTDWTFYVEDLEPAIQETFSADQSIDSILSDNFICF